MFGGGVNQHMENSMFFADTFWKLPLAVPYFRYRVHPSIRLEHVSLIQIILCQEVEEKCVLTKEFIFSAKKEDLWKSLIFPVEAIMIYTHQCKY